MHDPPSQDIVALKRDPQLKVIEGPENSIVFLGMDQARAELLYGDAKGKNPFKDKRVRLALYQALDGPLLDKVVNRGTSITASVPLPNPVAAGIPEGTIKRHPYSPR